MDAPDLSERDLREMLDELAFINTALGGYGVSLRGLKALMPRACEHLRVLDVGTGGGDVPRHMVSWAARRGIDATVHGIDLSDATVAYAREKTGGIAGLTFSESDLHDLEGENEYDVVHTALTLHHFDDSRAPEMLRKMFALCRWGVVINDLHRHPLAYHSIALLTKVFSRSEFIRNDAPLSVLRAFRRSELFDLAARAGVPRPRITWHWAFRWLVVFQKEGDPYER